MKFSFILTFILPLIISCSTPEVKKVIPFHTKIERAHKKESFISNSAIKFDIALTFNGKERLKGSITTSTDSKNILVEYGDNLKIITKENYVYTNDTSKALAKVRFDALTWSYFFLFPYKLSDPGTKWTKVKNAPNSNDFLVNQLSFDKGTGDAPDDWYMVYADTASHILQHAAYIVTANKTLEEAEKNPHAIAYHNYKDISGVPIAHKWVFWEWNFKDGLTKKIGHAELSNMTFLDEIDGIFEFPKTFIEVP